MRKMRYCIVMNRKVVNSRGKVNKRFRRGRRRMGLHVVFLITFCAVITVGLAGLLMMKSMTSESAEEEIAEGKLDTQLADVGKNEGTLTLFGERIPEKPEDETGLLAGQTGREDEIEKAGEEAESERKPDSAMGSGQRRGSDNWFCGRHSF